MIIRGNMEKCLSIYHFSLERIILLRISIIIKYIVLTYILAIEFSNELRIIFIIWVIYSISRSIIYF